MERKRLDLAGGAPRPAAHAAASGSQKKNLILLTLAGVFFLIAAYFVYAYFVGTVGPPPDAQGPEVDAVFEEAAKRQPPPQDNEPLPPVGSGKQPQ